MNKTTIIKVSGQDVVMTKLGHRNYHFSAMVNGQHVTASHYSRYGVCVIREAIKTALK